MPDPMEGGGDPFALDLGPVPGRDDRDGVAVDVGPAPVGDAVDVSPIRTGGAGGVAVDVGSDQTPENVGRNSRIPEGHKSWSLFLPSFHWLDGATDDDIRQLHRTYRLFGHQITRHHCAVWFWATHADPPLFTVENVDLARCAELARIYRARPDEGPHLTITSAHPDESREAPADDGETLLISFRGLTRAGITNVLGDLATRMHQGTPFEEVEVAVRRERLLSWVRRFNEQAGDVLRHVSLKLKFGPAEVGING